MFSINVQPAGSGQGSARRSGVPLQESPLLTLNLNKMEILIKFMLSWHAEEAKDKYIKAGDTIPAALLRGGAHCCCEGLIE